MLQKRQGDVLFIKMKKRDIKFKGEGTEKKKLTVALGEVTGHHHTVFGADKATIIDHTDYTTSSLNRDQNLLDTMIFEIKNGKGIVRHDEHDPTLLEETEEDEVWVRTIQREFNPIKNIMINVLD